MNTTHPTALCVDLDGSLLNTDLLWECLLIALKTAPWRLLMIPLWLLRGKQHLKIALAAGIAPDVSVLPYDKRVLEYIARERAHHSTVVLVTASIQPLADRIATHLGLFDLVLGSSAERNLGGAAKSAALVERFGERGFDYIANERVDLRVWAHARRAITVNAARSVLHRIGQTGADHVDLGGRSASTLTWLKAIRLHQWAKNALIFVPLLTAHHLTDIGDLLNAVQAFIAFGLCASATYIINDLLDLEADRHHAKKRNRPFASGNLPITHGLVACVLLAAMGVGLTITLPPYFAIALGTYIVSTLLYSFRLKRVASLDVIMLAALYTLRVIAGGLAIEVPISFWLLAFSMFIFLCLALVKRVSELIELAAQNKSTIRGREYDVADLPILQTMGSCSGYIAVLVLALYINSEDVKALYASPFVLWLIAPLMLLWVTRLWVVTSRGYMNEDPIVWAIKDPETWVTAAVTGVILFLAAVLAL